MRIAHAVAVTVLVAATTAFAQDPWFRGFGGRGEGAGIPPRFFHPSDFDGAFQMCRMMYRSVRAHQRGLGWGTDYPYAEINLSTRFSELTRTRISRDTDGTPNYYVVRASDDQLFNCPYTVASDVGTMGLSDAEARQLRTYLLKGGFLWVDDFWGNAAWQHWSGVMKTVLPEYTIEDVALTDPIFQTQFSSNYNVAFASYLMAMAPAIIVYLFTQRWVMAGVTQGAIK